MQSTLNYNQDYYERGLDQLNSQKRIIASGPTNSAKKCLNI